MKGYVCILASKRNGARYTDFTTRHDVKTLVRFEEHDLLVDAFAREKTIKKWPWKWKLDLIERMNPEWDDIAHFLHGL
jgi:putative endonuclease